MPSKEQIEQFKEFLAKQAEMRRVMMMTGQYQDELLERAIKFQTLDMMRKGQ